MSDQEQQLPPLVVVGAGGFIGSALAFARKRFRQAADWPVNMAMRVFDSCWQNDFGHEQPTPEAGFTVLPYSGLDMTRQMAREQAGISDVARDINFELLAAEEAVLTKDGALKSPHALAPVLYENSALIESETEATVSVCDRNIPQINRRAMNFLSLATVGGTSWAVILEKMLLNYLRRMDPAVAGGRDYSQVGIIVGASFFESDPLHSRMQAIQASFLRMIDILGREGTATHDHRFQGGILPGLERYLAGVAAGQERALPPNFATMFLMIEKEDMAGGQLNLDELKAMIHLFIKYWAALPTLVSALLSRLSDTYRDVRGRQIAEGAWYRFGSVGMRAVELAPLEEPRRILLAKAVGEKALGQGDEEVILPFSPESVGNLRDSWERALAEEGVVLPSENTLVNDFLIAPDSLSPIMREVEKVRQTMPHRLAQVLDSRTADSLDAQKAELRSSLHLARSRGPLRAVLAAMERLSNRLEAAPSALSPEGDWQTRLETLARQLDMAKPAPEVPAQKPTGLWGRISWMIGEVIRSTDAERVTPASQLENSITSEMRQIARDAARLILERARLVRDNEIDTLLAGIRSFVKDELDAAIHELRAQIEAVAAYVASAEMEAKSLHAQGGEYSAICFKLSVPWTQLVETLPVTTGMVEATLAALAAGKGVEEALSHGAPLAVDFVEMLLANDEARRYLARNASVEPQNRIDRRELGKARAVVRRFIVIPDDPRVDALLDSLKLPENIERHRVPGLKAVVCYAQIDALPVRAFQTTRLCEKALDSMDPRNRSLVTLWKRYEFSPSKSAINRMPSNQKVKAALMLTPHSTEAMGLALKLNGIPIFGEAELHPFLEYHGQRFRVPGDVALSGSGNKKITFQPVFAGMNVSVAEAFVVKHLKQDLKVLAAVEHKIGQPTIHVEATGRDYYLPHAIDLTGANGAQLAFNLTSQGFEAILGEPFNYKLLEDDDSVIDEQDLDAQDKILLSDSKRAVLTRASTGEEFDYHPKPSVANITLPDKAILVRQSTGEQYHYWPHDRTLWQDEDNVWWIAFNIPGGTRFERSLHTEDLVVAMDIIFQDDDFRRAIDEHLQQCVINLDVGAETLLKSVLAPLETWLSTQRHLIESQSWDQVDDADKPEREAIEDLYPVIEDIHDDVKAFANTRWSREYRRSRPGNLAPLRRTGTI